MHIDGEDNTGLILTGGGARGAYQVGVLKAIAELSNSEQVAFSVISGVSVGALNAVGLASKFSDFTRSVECLETFWRSLRTENVFDVRFRKIGFTGMRMFLSELIPFTFLATPNSLLDTRPLHKSLSRSIDLDNMSQSITAKKLRAVSVTCSGYTSGHAVTYFQSSSGIDDWHRVRRDGLQQKLTIDHIMASAALPVLFPAVKIDNEYFGDGALRLTSPLAPAIHLNASRLFIIGTRDRLQSKDRNNKDVPQPPTIGDLGGYALDTLFHDSLDADIERLERINKTLARIPANKRTELSMEQIETLTINPSKDLQKMALEHFHEMPRALKWVLRRKKAAQNNGRLESYLLFEPGYIGSLIDLGYKDAKARALEIQSFLKPQVMKDEQAA